MTKYSYIKPGRVLLAGLALLLISSVLVASCQQQAPAPAPLPPAPGPSPPVPPPAEGWVPDGVIGSSEYLGESSFSGGDYELYWTSDEQFLYVGMRAKTSGWVSMAIQPGSQMQDADMVFGFVEGGTVTIFDMFSTGPTGPHPPDTDQGGSHDIVESGGTEENGVTTIEFKRALNTGDQYDHALSSGTHQILWSYGSSDSPGRKHSSRGYGEIDLP